MDIYISGYFGIGGVIVGSLLTWLIDHLRQKKQTKKRALYLASRVIPILDTFINGCINVACDDGTIYGAPSRPNGEYRPTKALPELSFDSLNVDWSSIDQALLIRILSLPNELNTAYQIIDDADNNSSPPEYDLLFTQRDRCFSKLGLEACDLTNTLKNKYNIPKPILKSWKPETVFKEHLEKLKDYESQ